MEADRIGKLGLGLACALLLAAACEQAPPPGPPPDIGELKPLEKTPTGAARSEELKKSQPPPVDTRDLVDGGVRLRWKVPAGQTAQAFRFTVRPSRPGGHTALKVNTRGLQHLPTKKRLALRQLSNLHLPAQYNLTGLVRIGSQEYGTLAVDYILGRLRPRQLPRDKRLARILKKAQGKVLVTAELGANGAVLGVDSPIKGDYNLQLILLELPEKRVKPGDTWSLNLRAFTDARFEQKALDEEAKVRLVKIDQAGERVLATLAYDVRMKQKGTFKGFSRRPIPQSIDFSFKGRGVFDVTRGCWKSLSGRYRMTGKGLIQYKEDQQLRINALKKVPAKLLAAD